jgi:hypothetical protein
LPFALGSLGFLTNFDYSNYKKTIDHVVDDGIRVNLRMRFTCVVYRAVAPEEDKYKGSKRKAIKSSGGDILISRVGKEGWDSLESTNAGAPPCKQKKDKEIMCYSTRPVETFEVLNDLVVDRGPSPYVSLLELFGECHFRLPGVMLKSPIRRRPSFDNGSGRRPVHRDTNRIDSILPLRRRIPRTSWDSGIIDLPNLPAHIVFQADAFARLDGGACMRAIQLEKHRMGKFRRSRANRIEA